MASYNETTKLIEMIRQIDICMLTTADKDGTLRSRPMGSKVDDFDGTLWFFTRASSHKAEEVAATQQVNLAYAEPTRNNFVSISGTAEVVRDRARAERLWSGWAKIWFPKGLDDPDLALLKVTVERAEYWDMPNSTMVYLYGLAKATLTGKAPHPGETHKLDFNQAAE